MELKEQMIQWRHYLHEYPESAFEEVNTAKYLSDVLRGMGLDVTEGVGKTGLVATLKAGDGEGAIGIRADIDCIKLQEKGTPPYASRTPNRMHACGHDGHMATILGTAKLLSERRNFSGTVHFIFQPAEEPGKGAQAMIDDGLFERFPMDEVYGLHNRPELPAGTIHMRVGACQASEDNFTIEIAGRGGHASAPHTVIDPLVTAAQIITSLQTIVSRNTRPIDTAVVSCTELYMDGVHNAIPSNVTIMGDTRSFSPDVQALIERRMRIICESICAMNGAGCSFRYTHEFVPAYNAKSCVNIAARAARNIVGGDHVNADCDPIVSSDDFGVLAQRVPGCFVFLGAGTKENLIDNIPVHNAHYDYNDDILELGAEFFAEIIRLRLPQKA